MLLKSRYLSIVFGLVLLSSCLTTKNYTKDELIEKGYNVKETKFINFTSEPEYEINSPKIYSEDCDIDKQIIKIPLKIKRKANVILTLVYQGTFKEDIREVESQIFYEFPYPDKNEILLSTRVKDKDITLTFKNDILLLDLNTIVNLWKNDKNFELFYSNIRIGTVNLGELTSSLKNQIDETMKQYEIGFLFDKSIKNLEKVKIFCQIANLQDYISKIETDLIKVREKEEQFKKVISKFSKYHGDEKFSSSFDNLSNPYYYEKNDGYYFSNVVPTIWLDDKTYQAYCIKVSPFGDKRSSYFYVNIGNYKPSDISKNTIMGTDFGQNLILRPDGVYGVSPKFKLEYINKKE